MLMRRNASVRGLRVKRVAIALLVLAALLFSFVKSCGAPPPEEDGITVNLDAQDAQSEDAQTSDMLLTWVGKTILTPQLLMSASLPVLSGIPTDATASWQGKAAQEAMAGVDQEEIDPEVGDDIKIELTNLDPKDFTAPKLAASGPQILIYHTHTCEAYTRTAADSYVATGNWRTDDQNKSVVRVGEAMAKELREKYGFSVIHDTTDHEPPKLGTAYERSLVTMQAYKKKYPNLNIFIDIHRDAYSSKNGSDAVMIEGKSLARVMFVVGMGKSASFKVDWQHNFKLAQAITDKLNAIKKGLGRDVRVKQIRTYNQYLTDMRSEERRVGKEV